jgi:hypothetical protein
MIMAILHLWYCELFPNVFLNNYRDLSKSFLVSIVLALGNKLFLSLFVFCWYHVVPLETVRVFLVPVYKVTLELVANFNMCSSRGHCLTEQ